MTTFNLDTSRYGRRHPRWRKTQELRRAGYRKLKEELDEGQKVVVYVQRRYGPAGLVPIREARVYPDGSSIMTEYD